MSDPGANGGPAVDEITARLAFLEGAFGDLTDSFAETMSGGAETGRPAGPASPAPEPAFPTVETWVAEWFAPTFARRPGGTIRWCPVWWEHAEAIVRLTMLWRTWEVLRLDPAVGMGTWFRDHLDPQMHILLGPDGPFSACEVEGDRAHNPPPELPVQPAPAGYWGQSG